jgi:hypothetical protein
LESPLETTIRLQELGFGLDLTAVDGGLLRCLERSIDYQPEDMTVVEIVRYEGASDPADEEILFALTCGDGNRGLYTAPFGPAATPADVEVFHRLPGPVVITDRLGYGDAGTDASGATEIWPGALDRMTNENFLETTANQSDSALGR